MRTIPDQPRERLATASITPEDGEAIIRLMDLLESCIRVAGQAPDRVGSDPDRLANWRAGAWSAVAGRYQDLIGGARAA
ncbi:MAG: hypothetical protein ACRDRS_03815 [Pseudonocardiaceae bacterium]